MNCRSLLLGGLLPWALLCVVGCSGVRSSGDPDFRLGQGETFAWSRLSGPSGSLASEVPWDRFEAAIEAQLEARGLNELDQGAPDVVIEASLDLSVETQENHPFYELYSAERFEQAVFVLDLNHVAEPVRRWRSETRYRLRDTERMVGGTIGATWHPVDEERDWRVNDVVESLFGQLPGS